MSTIVTSIDDLRQLLAEKYGLDPSPARRFLDEVSRGAYKVPPEDLTEEQAARLAWDIKAGNVRRPPTFEEEQPMPAKKKLVDMNDQEIEDEFGDGVDASLIRRDLAVPGDESGTIITDAGPPDLHAERAKRNVKPKVNGRKHLEPALAAGNLRVVETPDDAGEVRMIPVNKIVQSTFNPRRDFNEIGIAALAEQLKAQGQLHNLVVRPHTLAGHFEIVCGERRWRAAQLLGWKELRCLVKSIDLGAAAVDALIENVGAQSLNAIEEAIGYKQVIDTGVTHTALGKMLGISQGQVSNRLRLLDLPAEWQARVISREMPATHARELTAWSHRPAVLEEVAREIRSRRWKLEDMSLNEFTDVIRQSVREVTRPMAGHFWFEVRGGGYRDGCVSFKATAEQRAELDVEEIRTGRGKAGKSERCFNLKLWDELQSKAEQEERERHGKQLDRANKAGKAKRTPAQEKARREKLEKQYQGRLQKWKTKWLQQRIAERIDNLDAPMASRLVLFFCFQQNNLRRRDVDDDSTLFEQLVVANHGKHVTAGAWDYTDYWRTIASVGDAGVRHVANGLLRAWVCHDTESFQADIKAGDVEAIAETLGVDVAKEWKLTRDFLELHTTDQLRELAKEWHLPSEHIAGSTKRKDLIEAVLVYVDQVKCPQRLSPAKRGGKKGRKR